MRRKAKTAGPRPAITRRLFVSTLTDGDRVAPAPSAQDAGRGPDTDVEHGLTDAAARAFCETASGNPSPHVAWCRAR
jgi:hypothetical protein